MDRRPLYRISREDHPGAGERLSWKKRIHTSVSPVKEGRESFRVSVRSLLSGPSGSWRFLRPD